MHLALGRALAQLRDEDVLIVDSGMSHHNLRDFFYIRGNAASEAFDWWLTETVANPDPAARDVRLTGWLLHRQHPSRIRSPSICCP